MTFIVVGDIDIYCDCRELMDDGVGVIYMPYRDIITRIKQNVMDGEEYERIVARYKNAKVLLIDDLLDIDEAIGSRLIEMSRDYLVEMKGRKLNYRVYG